MGYKLTYTLAFLSLMMLLIPGTVFTTSGDGGSDNNTATDSVRITIDGERVEGPVKQGDVVHQGNTDGKCEFPDISIKMRGDVKRVKVGPEGGACTFKIKVLEMNDTPLPSSPEDASGFYDGTPEGPFQTTSGWRWRVQSLASKPRGIG